MALPDWPAAAAIPSSSKKTPSANVRQFAKDFLVTDRPRTMLAASVSQRKRPATRRSQPSHQSRNPFDGFGLRLSTLRLERESEPDSPAVLNHVVFEVVSVRIRFTVQTEYPISDECRQPICKTVTGVDISEPGEFRSPRSDVPPDRYEPLLAEQSDVTCADVNIPPVLDRFAGLASKWPAIEKSRMLRRSSNVASTGCCRSSPNPMVPSNPVNHPYNTAS